MDESSVRLLRRTNAGAAIVAIMGIMLIVLTGNINFVLLVLQLAGSLLYWGLIKLFT